MIYDARAAAALSLFKRKLHWRIMPAIALIQPLAPDRGISSGGAIGDAPTAAMEAEGS
jgi:hypothetical protein